MIGHVVAPTTFYLVLLTAFPFNNHALSLALVWPEKNLKPRKFGYKISN